MGTTRPSSTRSRLSLNSFDSSFDSSSMSSTQALQALRVALDDVDEADGRRRIVEGARAQRLGRRADGGDGRAKLVGGVGDEVATERLEATQLGHVDEHDEQALVVAAREERRVDEQAARLEPGQLDLGGARHLVALAGGFEEVLELRVADRLDEQLAHGIRAEQQHRTERGIDQHDAAVAIEHDDALLHRLQDATLAVSLGAQLPERRREATRQTIERMPELGELAARLGPRPHGQIPGGHPTGRLCELLDGRRDAPRDDVRQKYRQRERQRRGQPDAAAHVLARALDLAKRFAEPHDPPHFPIALEGRRRILDRLLPPVASLLGALPGRERRLHLRTREGCVAPADVSSRGDRRIPEHEAIATEDRYPGTCARRHGLGETLPRLGGVAAPGCRRRGGLAGEEACTDEQIRSRHEGEPIRDRRRKIHVRGRHRSRDEQNRDEEKLGANAEAQVHSEACNEECTPPQRTSVAAEQRLRDSPAEALDNCLPDEGERRRNQPFRAANQLACQA